MQCNNCGHERPRSGNCPHCGAPPVGGQSQGGGFSSLRNWKDQQPPSGGSYGGSGRVSRPLGPPDRSYGGRQSPGNSYPLRDRPGSGANWGSPNQSHPRRGYDDYGDDNALMIPDGPGAMMLPDDRALPALPSEDEERALGIRRPAFIPATDERKGKRPTQLRVVSGVASIVLLCVAMCGISGFLAQRNIIPGLNKLLGLSAPAKATAPVANIPTPYANSPLVLTPVATNTPLLGIGTYKSIQKSATGSLTAKDPSATFFVNDFIYVVMSTSTQVKGGDTVNAKWYFNNVDITNDLIKTKPDCCSQSVTKDGQALQVLFAIKVPQEGYGRVEISYNKTLVYTVLFYVSVPANTPTPTSAPATSPPTTGTPATTPTK